MFNFDDVENFDRHISVSIPAYDVLTRAILGLSQYWVRNGSVIYDLGCTTGKHLNMMKKVDGVEYIGIDKSSLLPDSNDFVTFINKNIVDVEYKEADLFLSIFTLQFLTRQERNKTIEIIKNKLKSGGALIVAEKNYFSDGFIQSAIDSVHKEIKSDNFSWTEIMGKEEQLRENMKPLRETELIIELEKIGTVHEFWRTFGFSAYVVLKK